VESLLLPLMTSLVTSRTPVIESLVNGPRNYGSFVVRAFLDACPQGHELERLFTQRVLSFLVTQHHEIRDWKLFGIVSKLEKQRAMQRQPTL